MLIKCLILRHRELFGYDRSGSGIRMASNGCLCKPGLLLRNWAPTWIPNGMGIQIGCKGSILSPSN